VQRNLSHGMLKHMEMTFAHACVKNGSIYVHADSQDVWKLDDQKIQKLVVQASTLIRDGGVREQMWKKVLLPYIHVTNENMSS